MKKVIGSVAVVAALGLGAFAISSVLPARAQTSGGSAQSDSPAKGPRAKAKAALDELVTNGTLTPSQEDAVIAALQGVLGKGHPGRPGPARAKALLGKAIDSAAGAIGITPDELKAELKAGKSVADVASEHGVSLDTVTTALTDAANAAIDQAVTNGKLTQDRADAMKARVPDAVTAFENGHKGDLRKAWKDHAGTSDSSSSSTSS